MKITELRIGNWVYSDEIETPVQIELISIDNWVSFGMITFDQPTIEEIKPIPLTEEWLLNFGFRYSDMFCCFVKDGYMVEQIGHLLCDRRYGVVIKYVHELQNLVYSLCGKELELNP